MLSAAELSFLASIDLPSLRHVAEEIARPQCEMAAHLQYAFGEPVPGCQATRQFVGREIAMATSLSAIARLLKALENDAKGTLSVLAKADVAAYGPPVSPDGGYR